MGDPAQTAWDAGQFIQDLATFTAQAATQNTSVNTAIVVVGVALDGQSTIVGSFVSTELSNGNLPNNIISDIGAYAAGTAATGGIVAFVVGSTAAVPISVALAAGAGGILISRAYEFIFNNIWDWSSNNYIPDIIGTGPGGGNYGGPGGGNWGGGWGGINGISPSVGSDFSSGQSWVQRADPLTLDLDGDGIETLALAQPGSGATPVYFDYNVNGAKVNTAWISPDDGMLVMDRNGNGTIDDGSELFSNYTPLNNGGTAANGYAALKQEDTNQDGVVNNLDANWNNLKIWRDLNSDGISQSEELFTLEQMGITGLTTQATNNQYTFTKADGTTGVMADVHSAVDTFHQQFTEAIPVSPDVENLPDMQGSGLVRSLHEAASQSPELANLLTQYSQATTRAEQLALMDQLLLAWADTSGLIATMEERNTTGLPLSNYYTGQEGTMLHILEAFNGRYFFSLPGEKNLEGASAVTGVQPVISYYIYYDANGHRHRGSELIAWQVPFIPEQYNLLHKSYDALQESVYESLFYQTRFQTVFIPLLDKIEFVVDENNQITWDYTQLKQYFADAIAADAANGLSDLLEFNRYVANNFLPVEKKGSSLCLALGSCQ